MAWKLSGTNHNGVYDPVTTTSDRVYIRDPDDDGGIHWPGGSRVYMTLRNYHTPGLKNMFGKIRNRTSPRCVLMGLVVTLLLLLLVMVIVLSAQKPQPAKQWVKKATGLNFYPAGEDNGFYIRYSLHKPEQISEYTAKLDMATKPYESFRQEGDDFADCSSTYAPADKVCRETLSEFGSICTHFNKYGFDKGTPCILLALNLPQNTHIRAVPKNHFYQDAKDELGDSYNPDFVGVTCQAATPEDVVNIGNSTLLDNHTTIVYNPAEGFLVKAYDTHRSDKFLPQAVMVHFNSIHNFHDVHITCKAWGVAYNSQSESINKEPFSATFTLRIE